LKLNLFAYRLENKKPFRIAHGSRTFTDTLFVQIDHEGIVGTGEASHVPYYNIKVEDSIALIGRLWDNIVPAFNEDHAIFWRHIDALFGSNHFAKCALDLAFYDWKSQKAGLPLWKYLGLGSSDLPQSSFTIAMGSEEEMREALIESDFSSFKIKLGGEDDLAALKYLRSISSAPFKIDVNSGWSLAKTLEVLPYLEEVKLELIEQPLSKELFEENNVIRAKTSIPLFADESCFSLSDVQACAPFFDGINIKLSKCGGIFPALEMVDLARSMNLKLMIGCMTESSIGISSIAHLSSLFDFVDMDGAALLKEDPAAGVKLKNGMAVFNSKNGHGAHLLIKKDGA
jgi:L-alanine-DL-glutamate epimerase-like enolase superfamily enzyme